MNYKQLYYFWNVAKHGGVARAAEQLFLTPQTISGQISDLESSLNTKLFNRIGKRLTLTTAGQLAYSHADEIFQIGKELEALLARKQEENDLVFRVGVSDVIPKSVAYQLLAPAITINERIKLICLESKLELLFSDLALHKIDMILSDRPLPSDLGIKGYSHFLGQSPLAFYGSSILAGKLTENFPYSLDGAPILLPGKDSMMRIKIDRWLMKHKLQPHIKGEFDDTALMKAFAQNGFGAFPGPNIIAQEVAAQQNVQTIGVIEDLSCRYYAISAQRQQTHPAVVAISEFAETKLLKQS